MAYEWTEMAFFEVQAGNTAMAIFAVAVLMVFLVLAAQYESWSLPLAVILVVPMCLLSAIVGVSAMPLLLPKSLVGRRPGGHQHLHADRLRGAGGTGQQERDPDRGVRQAPAGRGRAAARGDPGGLQAPLAADRDDLAGVHPRRAAPVDRPRRRGRDAADPGHGRLQRHAGRDAVRHLPHAGLLQRHRLAGRHAGVPLAGGVRDPARDAGRVRVGVRSHGDSPLRWTACGLGRPIGRIGPIGLVLPILRSTN